MERDRGFNFKLLVPPRLNKGQVSAAARPQETVENSGDFINTMEQGYSKCSDKEQSTCFVNASVVAPTKPTRPDFPKMKAVPPMEKNEIIHNPGQLYSKLFDEVEKIKSWKVKTDSDTVQKERRLQESKKTIETQRKAIQELQFGNESLSMKLEEQISENEELRDKNNATRTLCNILKDTFERSAEKMHLFESEREETHHIFMENSAHIQKLVKAFESLQIQVETDQREMEKVKEGFQQFEILKEKYNEEYNLKEKEVAALQTELKEKENQLQKILFDFHETQKHCRQLEDTSNEQYELLKSSETERESLLHKLQSVEQCLEDTDKKVEAIAAQLMESKEDYAKMIQSKDSSFQVLSSVKAHQAEKLEHIQKTIQELQNSLSFEIQRAKELEAKLMVNEEELERKNTLLEETTEQSVQKDGQIQSLEDELEKRWRSVEFMEGKIGITEDKMKELEAELVKKNEEAEMLKNEVDVALAENALLKKTCEAAEEGQEDLKKKSAMTEVKVKELEQQLFSEMKKKEEQASQMEKLRKDFTLHKETYTELLSNFNELQSEKKTIEQQLESGSSNEKAIKANIKVNEEKVMNLTKEIQRLEEENQSLREEVNSIKTRMEEECQDNETMQQKIEEKCEHLQEEITEKEKEIKSAETKLSNLRKKFDLKLKANEEFQKENKALKKQIAKEIAKSNELETTINSIYEETQNLKQLNEEDHQKLLKDLESKSTSVAELESEVQKLRLTTADAIKTKEDAELKCQHKIADMVALMEKHKSRYDQIVEEKDAELDEKKKREMETVSQIKSLELDLLKNKAENDQLKQELKTEVTEKTNLQMELTDLKKEVSSMKITQLSEARNKQYSQGKLPDTTQQGSAKRHVFDFSMCRKTPSNSKAIIIDDKEPDVEFMKLPCGTTPKTQKIQNADLKTPKSIRNKAGGSSKIKSYRIRTPPSTEKAARWRKNTVELDPKSDSSELNDLLTFASAPTPNFPAPPSKLNVLKKIQSPAPHKSPGNSLKLAAMKRMRDAGWTAVAGCDKKKKKVAEKIFA